MEPSPTSQAGLDRDRSRRERIDREPLFAQHHSSNNPAKQARGGRLAGEISDLIAGAFDAHKLKILVFGPQVHTPSAEERTAKLQNKRIDIKAALEALGHHVKYAEEIVDPSLGGAAGNAFFQELLIMGEYDFIVTLVDTPGSITEAAAIASNPHFAQKASLFLDSAFVGGLVSQACENAAHMGAHYSTYDYPADLDECHLLGHIRDRASAIQMIKYLL